MATIDITNLSRALKVTPRASQTASKAPGEVGPRFGPGAATDFPLFATNGEGAYLFDDRGRRYLDCAGANAAIPLGYAHPEVVEAVTRALRRGSLLSLPHLLEQTVSEKFLATCAPWAEQVRWVKTGSEACHAAFKTAKLATGRKIVLMGDWAYHGWHEWCADSQWKYPFGSPIFENGYFETKDDTGRVNGRVAEYMIAAIFVEPHRWLTAPAGWLEGLRKTCDRIGALLVFDEIVYGLRWAKGGSAEYYGVTPDLACFGKALGNGVAVACLCGKADVMAACGRTVSGTYGGETLGLAAAGAVLDIYRREDVIGRLWTNGSALWEAFRTECSSFADDAPRLEGTAVHWRLAGLAPDALDRTLQACADRGLLVHRAANNASAAMTLAESVAAGKALGAAALMAVQEGRVAR